MFSLPPHPSPKYTLLKVKVKFSLNKLRHIGGVEFYLHAFATFAQYEGL
jgi:hypothetical protein